MRNFTDYESMAMLELSEAERELLIKRFDEITTGFSVLDDFETNGVEPLVSVLGNHNIMREDVASKIISREELLENAPEQKDGYFQVPATIE